jgi:TPR repeat protein
MKTKLLTFLLSLTFLFVFSGSVYGQEEVKKESFLDSVLNKIGDTIDRRNAKNAYKEKDYKTAHKLFLQLAEEGDAEAQYKLGEMYKAGQGVKKDYKEAVKRYLLSADQGHTKARIRLGEAYLFGELGVTKDHRKAKYWFYRVADETGNADARYWIGFMYARDSGSPENYASARKWFQLAADRGHLEAKYMLAGCSFATKCSPFRAREAFKMYRDLAEQRHNASQFELAKRLEMDYGVIRPPGSKRGNRKNRTLDEVSADYILAYTWYSFSILGGNKKAIEGRNRLEKKMTPNQIEGAEVYIRNMKKNWRPSSIRKVHSSLIK